MNKRRDKTIENKLIEKIKKFERVHSSIGFTPDSTFLDEDSVFESSVGLSIRSLGIDTTSYESIMHFRNTSYMQSKEDDYFKDEVNFFFKDEVNYRYILIFRTGFNA